MTIVLILFAIGLFCVIKGGDWFVDSATEIAQISGLPPIFIGATIVSMATTLPEVIVSVTAATQGETTMSVGNGIGSIICNTGFILAISAIFGSIHIKDKSFKTKAIVLIGCLLLLAAMSFDYRISRWEAMLLIAILVIYMLTNITLLSQKEVKKLTNDDKPRYVSEKSYFSIAKDFILGIIFIVTGSHILVENGVMLAEYIGVPTAIVSLTLIALGTSLPELVTGITSLVKGNEDIGLGNIIGANILNVLLVIGASGMVTELTIIPQNLVLDIPVALLLAAIMLIPALFIKRIGKAPGIAMVAVYFSYVIYMWKNVI